MLEFLGVTFLVLVGLILALVVWVFLKIQRVSRDQERLQAIEGGLDADPIMLQPLEHADWVHPEAVAQLAASLEACGATAVGAFAAPAAGTRLYAFVLSSPPAYAVIYDHDQLRPWVDVVTRSDNGKTFTVSSVDELARGAPRPPEDEVHFFPATTAPAELVNAAAAHAARVPALPAPPEDFQSFFEAAAKRSQDSARTEPVSQEWLEKLAQGAGVELAGNEADQINFGREAERYSQTQAACLKALAESGAYTAAEWEELRDSLVAVWDGMPEYGVSGVFYDFADLPDKHADEVEELEDSPGTARERVAQFNASLPLGCQLELIGSVSSPVSADVYRGKANIT